MWGLGEQVDMEIGGRSVSGKIAGVDSHGALIVSDAEGVEHAVYAADSRRMRAS
jgi:biotin-(acetyl-CoA carboxylase) ligase